MPKQRLKRFKSQKPKKITPAQRAAELDVAPEVGYIRLWTDRPAGIFLWLRPMPAAQLDTTLKNAAIALQSVGGGAVATDHVLWGILHKLLIDQTLVLPESMRSAAADWLKLIDAGPTNPNWPILQNLITGNPETAAHIIGAIRENPAPEAPPKP